MEAVVERSNMMLAYQRVVENKGAAGVDGLTGRRVRRPGCRRTGRRDQSRHCWRAAIIPQPVRKVEIPKPQGGVRTLGHPDGAGPADPTGAASSAATAL